MRQYRDWKKLLALMLALVLAMATPLQASEINQEDAGEDVVIVEDAGSTVTTILAQSPEEVQEDTTTPVEDEPEVVVNEISTIGNNSVPSDVAEDAETSETVEQTSEENSEDTVWLHVVNGNFSGSYNGNENISKEASIEVKLGEGRTLPNSVSTISATRTNGIFVGWYTQAPTETLVSQEDGAYSVWHTESKNGKQIEAGEAVPEGVNVLYAAFDDAATEAEDGDKLVEFYLDWNGINGQTARLTCIRSYNNGDVKFTAQDAAVYNLNFTSDCADSDLTWEKLQEIWAGREFNGYKFLGWSTDEKGETGLIWEDIRITNGMSLYAQWEKDGKSSKDFDRTIPEVGPLDAIRILAGGGTEFLSGTLHASKHAKKGESFTLNLFCTPIGAEVNNVIWSVAVSNSVTPEAAFRPGNNADPKEVKAGTSVTVGGINAKADGCSLTITSNDDEEHVITVSATAESNKGKKIASPTEATLSFAHSWDVNEVTEATCETKGSIVYYCTVCGKDKTKKVDIPALEHVYNKNKNLNKGDSEYYKVNHKKEPTCTEEGVYEYTYKCLRCGEEIEKPEVVKVPALGHDWSETVVPASCNKNEVIEVCTRDGCTARKTSLVPADNPDLHKWKETSRYHETCKSDYIYEQCEVCRKTRSRTVPADNPDRHSYAFESRVVNDCEWVTYTFKCVFGCGATQVTLKKEENHVWGGWTVTTTLDKTTGMMERIQTRKCSRCGKEETKDLGSVAAGVAEESAASVGNNTVATQPMSYSAGNAVAAAVAQAAPSSATASEGNAGWKKSGKKTYYLNANGKKKTGWQKIDGKKYYFGKDGVMKTGWQTIKGKKYYFGKDGVMRTGKQKIGKKTYNFGKNGVLK